MSQTFPANFLWGSASAAYQIEGAANADGKGTSVWDIFAHEPGTTFEGTNGDLAVDHYHHLEEDVALMARQGLKAYRFSVAWTRILPEGSGKVNEAGLAFYDRLVNALLAHHIEPVLTIYHWDLPEALQERYGGFESRQLIPDFVNYAKILFDHFSGRVKYWVSLNEQNVFIAHGYRMGLHPPNVRDEKRMYAANHIANLVNASVINLFHELHIPGQIGPSFAYTPNYALDSKPADVLSSEMAEIMLADYWLDVYLNGRYPEIAVRYLTNKGVMPEITEADQRLLSSAKPDFIGFNYYQSATIAHNPIDGVGEGAVNTSGKKGTTSESGVPGLYKKVTNPYVERTDWDWEIDPTGLEIALIRLTRRYHYPILITENGLGAFDELNDDHTINDQYRINYLRTHVAAMGRAIDAGCRLLGYCTWSFTDLLSWLNGYQKRYGFVYVDRDEHDIKTLARYPKASYYWYKQVIESNGEKLD